MNHMVWDAPTHRLLYALIACILLAVVLGVAAYVWAATPIQHRHSGCSRIPLVTVHGKLQPAYPCRTAP